MNLVSHNVLSMKRNSPQELSDSNNPGIAQARQGSASTGMVKQMRSTGQNAAEHSQVRQQEGTQNAESWKQEKKSDSSHSTGVRKQTRSVNKHMNRSVTEFRNMEIPNHHHLEKVYRHL